MEKSSVPAIVPSYDKCAQRNDGGDDDSFTSATSAASFSSGGESLATHDELPVSCAAADDDKPKKADGKANDELNESGGKASEDTGGKKIKKRTSSVRFSTVAVHEFAMTLDVNPGTSEGPSVRLETQCQSTLPEQSVDDFEKTKLSNILTGTKLPAALFYLSTQKRRGILQRAGFTEKQIKRAGKASREERLLRCMSNYDDDDSDEESSGGGGGGNGSGTSSIQRASMRSAGFTEQEMREAGKKARLNSLKSAGFTEKEIREAGKKVRDERKRRKSVGGGGNKGKDCGGGNNAGNSSNDGNGNGSSNKKRSTKKRLSALLRLKSLKVAAGRRASNLPSHEAPIHAQ